MALSHDKQRFLDRIKKNVFVFAREAMRFTPTHQQAELLQAVQDYHDGKPGAKKRIACKSGQGPGKTTISGIIGLWRTVRKRRAQTIVTAPTMSQCRDVWLTELSRSMEGADPWFARFIRVTKSKVIIGNDPKWRILPKTSATIMGAQGFHHPNMTIIVEEASGVDRGVIEQYEGTLSNPDALLLLVGNPNIRDCAFFDCFYSARHKWNCITFNAEESPDWLVEKENHEYLREKYGRQSDVYRVRVLGEFPKEDPCQIISAEAFERCTKLDMLAMAGMPRRGASALSKPAQQFGIDLARFGDDESVVYRRAGNAIVEGHNHMEEDPNDTVDHAIFMQGRVGWRTDSTIFVVDATGMGQGVLKRFVNARRQHYAFHNNASPYDSQFDNKITEAWFNAREYIHEGGVYIPKDQILQQQLTTRYYNITKKGKIVVESKDDYKKRTKLPSPGRADAFVMALYDRTATRMRSARRGRGRSVGLSGG